MDALLAIPLPVRLAVLFVAGALLGCFTNWAVYQLAWYPRNIGPWSPLPPGLAPRTRRDKLPIFGWLFLRREADAHGRGFWIRPLVIEVALGIALAAFYWWSVDQQRIVLDQEIVAAAGRRAPLHALIPDAAAPPGMLHAAFCVYVLLLVWMAAASFIDIDEKIIPDAITVTGTLLGLVLGAALPLAHLPHVAHRFGQQGGPPPAGQPQPAPPQLGHPITVPAPVPAAGGLRVPAMAPAGGMIYVEPVTATAPNPWPPQLAAAPNWRSLLLAWACYLLWCFALTPRIWRGRRGPRFALRMISARVCRELLRPPLAVIALAGLAGIAAVWWWGEAAWIGLLTALLGLVGGGGIVWAVRLIGTAALRREAMGFGDVTLMMMIGTFVGWQAALVVFFLAPFCGLVVGLAQLILRRDDEIPYGPFLCGATMVVVVLWAPIWNRIQLPFEVWWLVPAVLAVGMALLGVMLWLSRQIRLLLFGERGASAP